MATKRKKKAREYTGSVDIDVDCHPAGGYIVSGLYYPSSNVEDDDGDEAESIENVETRTKTEAMRAARRIAAGYRAEGARVLVGSAPRKCTKPTW
jgi:hypothetical protein